MSGIGGTEKSSFFCDIEYLEGILIVATACPVCKTEVEENKARGISDYEGKSYYFCSKACKKTIRRITGKVYK